MGRPKGDATRNKSRPSSSSVAASLLPSSNAPAVGFGGYVGSSRIDNSDIQDIATTMYLDGEVVAQLRGLAKKDAVTRLKALRALTGLFKECSVTELCLLLPTWIFEYRRLIQDCNQQVREATHNAMSALASSVGRELAPHLRSVMGAWWVSQFDLVREVALAGQQSFQTAFPGTAKRLEALSFCSNDILYYLDGLLKLTPQTISEKSTPLEEASKKYDLVISSALLALSALLDILLQRRKEEIPTDTSERKVFGKGSVDKIKEIEALAAEIINNHKHFREFVKAKSSQIRYSTYQALRSFILNVPVVFTSEGLETLGGIILGSFSEKDPSCHQAMWDMVLLLCKQYPDVWNTSFVHKRALPRLWGFLRHAAYGSAQISYPCILPLIRLIPESAVKPAAGFFNELFLSLWDGHLCHHMAPEDEGILLKAIQECFLWTIDNAERYSELEGLSPEQFPSFLVENILLKVLWIGYVLAGQQQMNVVQDSSFPALEEVLDNQRGENLVSWRERNGSQRGKNLVSQRERNKSPFDSHEESLDKESAENLHNLAFTRESSGAHHLKHISFSDHFLKSLRVFIMDIIEIIEAKKSNLTHKFWTGFHDMCLEIILNESRGVSHSFRCPLGCMDRISTFLTNMGKVVIPIQRHMTIYKTLKSLVVHLYPRIKITEHVDGIKLLAKLVSVFGPTLFSAFQSSPLNDENSLETSIYDEGRCLSCVFDFVKSDLMPWCLDGNESCSITKIELLLSFFEDGRFVQIWDCVLDYVTPIEQDASGSFTLNTRKITILACLVEKFREKFIDSKWRDDVGAHEQEPARQWHLSRLDQVAMVIVQSMSLTLASSQQLLRCMLGGFMECFCPPLLSDETVTQVIKVLLQHLCYMLSRSQNSWAFYAASDVLSLSSTSPLAYDDKNEVVDLGCAALQALCGSIHLVQSFEDELVVNIIVCLYCIKWDCSTTLMLLSASEHGRDAIELIEGDMGEVESDSTGENSVPDEGNLLRIEVTHGTGEMLLKMVNTISSVLEDAFCKGLSGAVRYQTWQQLVQCARYAIAEGSVEDSPLSASIWAKRFRYLVQLCTSHEECQSLICLLLEPTDFWPLFVVLPSKTAEPSDICYDWDRIIKEDDKHGRFVAFVAKFSSLLGWDKVLACCSQSDPREKEIIGIHCAWFLVELLCSWHWPGGSALESVIPFLVSSAAPPSDRGFEPVLEYIVRVLMSATLARSYDLVFTNEFWMGLHEAVEAIRDPCLRGLLAILKNVLGVDSLERTYYAQLFLSILFSDENLNDPLLFERSNALPFIISVLSPTLRKQQSSASVNDKSLSLNVVACEWMDLALTMPPLTVRSSSNSQHLQWTIISCFPLDPAGGPVSMMAAAAAAVSLQEKTSLIALFREKTAMDTIHGFLSHLPRQPTLLLQGIAAKDPKHIHQETIAKLVAASVAYCWQIFEVQDWARIINHMRTWLEAAVLEAEIFIKFVADILSEVKVKEETCVNNIIGCQGKICLMELSWTAINIFSLIHAIEKMNSSDLLASLHSNDWPRVKQRNLNYILQIFFASGMAESLLMDSVAGEGAVKAVASYRLDNIHFWENLAEIVMNTTEDEKVEAARYLNAWTVGKDCVRSLYALLFSCNPIGSVQLAAYCLLTSAPFNSCAVTYEEVPPTLEQSEEVVFLDTEGGPPSELAKIRHELAAVIELRFSMVSESCLTSNIKVQYFIGWALFLSHLCYKSVTSPAGERMVEYIQDHSILSTFLDALFQYIPLRVEAISQGKKKSAPVDQAENIGSAAKRAAASRSVLFAVEGLWPVTTETMSILATALYGLALQVIPACVRNWFTDLRDRSVAGSVENFTTNICSPQLLADEFSQIHKVNFADENLAIRANESMGEVTVIYKKEASIDMAIRLPKSYPLRAVDVNCTRSLGISETRVRKWTFSMAAFLRNQNGAVAEAIRIWKRNVDREFDGVEECPICYSIIHLVNHGLPRLACKTCRHKYHAACLYKWFSTSHKSTCPLCQTPF